MLEDNVLDLIRRLAKWFVGYRPPSPPVPPPVIEIPPIDYELPSPKIRIKDGDVSVKGEADGTVTAFIKNLPKGTCWGVIPNTGSMERSIDDGMRVLLAPQPIEKYWDLIVGDVIAYQTPDFLGGQLILHRITEIRRDAEGWFCLTRGDNPLITANDPWEVRADWLRWLYRGVIA